MGVNSKGIITRKINPLTVKDFLDNGTDATNVAIYHTKPEYMTFTFSVGDERRMLWVFIDNGDHKNIYSEENTLINLDAFGAGPRIIRQITEYFGGFYTANDCDDEWEYLEATGPNAQPATFEIELYAAMLWADTESIFQFITKNRDVLRELLNKYQEAE